MKLEQQVVSLDLAKRLKKLGVSQDSLYSWLNADPRSAQANDVWYVALTEAEHILELPEFAAFTVAELGEMMPAEVATYRYEEEDFAEWMCKLHVKDDWSKYINIIPGNTEADARAKMLIYLLENKLI